MIPKVEIENCSIEVSLTDQMSLIEVAQFIEDLKEAVDSFSDRPYTLLNNAEHKSFSELNAVKALSVGMRSVLTVNPPSRVAIYRPQNDYQNEESVDQPDRVQIFSDLDEAKHWLHPYTSSSSLM